MTPERLWALSRRLHRLGHPRAAQAVKLVNFVLYSAVLPCEVVVEGEVTLLHRGLGVVIHPRVSITGPTILAQHVTIGVAETLGAADAPGRIGVYLDRCFVGPSSSVIGHLDQPLTIGSGAAVGPNCYVSKDVLPGERLSAPRPHRQRAHDASPEV